MKSAHLALVILIATGTAYAQERENHERQETQEAAKTAEALAGPMKAAKIALTQGLEASQKVGKPISAKFEMEDGKLQLSVYTMKGDEFSEVIVDYTSGAIAKSEVITGGEDLGAAKGQAEAVRKAKHTLQELVAKAEKSHPGFKAVSIIPEMEKGKPHADLILLKGSESKSIEEEL